MVIIDFHTHVFPPQIKKNRSKYIDSDPCFAILYSDPKAKLATADELIASMDKDGVDISVMVNIGWTTHELCVETNDYILESIARYPRRLVGFCAVQPNSYEAAIAEIDRCAQAGIRGVGEMRPDIQLFDFSDEELMEIFRGGVFLDVAAWHALDHRGLAHLTGVRPIAAIERDAIEVLTNHQINDSYVGRQRNCRQSFWFEPVYCLETSAGGVEILAEMVDYMGRGLGTCLAAYENELGGRVVVAGYYPWFLLER